MLLSLMVFSFSAPKIQKKFIHLTQFAEIVVNIEKKKSNVAK